MKNSTFQASRRIVPGLLAALILILSLSFVFIGCGGGGGGGENDIDNSVMLNGTAAGGAPIIGTINVRGVNGNVSYSAIRSDGSFSVDVSELTAPFVVWAEGDVRGKSVTLYSTCNSAPGSVNVTPATDTAMAMAIGEDPTDYFQNNPDAGVPDQAALDNAVQTITDLLAKIFETLGLPTDFNIMTSQFNTDGQGFDLLLDMVSMENDGATAQIVDEGTQTPLLVQNLATGEKTINAGPIGANTIISGNLEQEGQIAMLLRFVEELYAERRPSADELAAALDNYVSTDFMFNGLTAAELYDLWGFEQDTGPQVGMTFSDISIHREMTTYTNGVITINEQGDNHAGVWVTYKMIYAGGEVCRMQIAFVQEADGEPWKWAGNRCPFLGGGEVDVLATMNAGDPDSSISSGLAFDIEDDGNLALDSGVYYVAIFNPALPTITHDSQEYNAVLMTRPDPEITELECISPNDPGYPFSVSDGLDIDYMNDLEFVFVAMDRNYQPLNIWIDILAAPPLAESNLSATPDYYFPTITQICGQSAANSIPYTDLIGGVSVSWIHPGNTDLLPKSAELGLSQSSENRCEYCEYMDNPAMSNPTLNIMDWTSTTFTYPSSISNPEWGYVGVEYMDLFERKFESTIAFTVE